MPDGPGGFAQNYSCSALLRIPLCRRRLRIRGYHPLWLRFPADSPRMRKCNDAVLQPRLRVATQTVWAIPRSLATTGGIIKLFSLPRGTKMFQFPRLASAKKRGCRSFRPAGCPIRKSADQRPFAPTRGLSQLITSFIASMSQGIHHPPLITFRQESRDGNGMSRL